MISDDKTAKNREIMITYSLKTNNVSKTCKLFGISRTAYYKWLKRYKEYGIDGLIDKKPSKPHMPNQTPDFIEQKVIDIVKVHPEYGPQRISLELKSQHIRLSNTGVYKVLKRRGLKERSSRYLFAGDSKEVLTKEKNKSSLHFTIDEIVNSYPGFMLLQETVHVDKHLGEGPVYQLTAIDCFSGFSFARLYNKKSSDNVIDMLETVVFPVFRVLEIDIKAVTTSACKEYATNYNNSKHHYEEFIRKNKIEHYIVTSCDNNILKQLTGFNEELYDQVYIHFIDKETRSILDKLNNALNEYLTYHNFKKVIKEGPCKGKTPAQVLTEYKGEDFPVPAWMYV